MRAMILAAGRGERMGELTQHLPKPLLKINDKYLIEYAIENIKRAGIHEIVINVAYLGQQIQDTIGDGAQYEVTIHYSIEDQRLEVGGGIYHALHLLGERFIVVSGDVITDYPLTQLMSKQSRAHLVLVQNPDFHHQGDFGLRQDGYVDLTSQPKFTFANIGIYSRELFAACSPGFFPWRDVMFPHIHQHKVTGEIYQGLWHNIGTPLELSRAEASII